MTLANYFCILSVSLKLEALSKEMKLRCPETLFNSGDLTLIRESLDPVNEKLQTWKGALESKRLRINVGKIKK